ncbi:MAG: hypothetical protein ACK5Q4_13560 [Phycisphaerae bacterium]|jgi:hypothetical protein
MASRIHFWDLLDAAPDACMPLSAWTERLGDDICVLRRFLIRNGTLATHIADHSSQAVRRAIRSDGEKWWREKATGEGLELTDVDSLVNWRVDWPNLTEEVRVALDLHKVANTRGTNFRATRIGRLDASEDSSTLVLSLATTPREQFTSLMECASDPGVVAFFTVSGAEWRDDFVRRVKEQDIALACLSEVIEVGPDTCQPSSRWNAVRERIRTTARLRQARHSTSTNEFRQVHNDWLISFSGQQIPLAHKTGLVYLHELLSKPHQSLGALELLAVRDEHRAADIRAIGREEHVRANGRRRRERETAEFRSMKNSIIQDIQRAVEAIADRCPGLATHLRASVSVGSTFRYSPKIDMGWTL